MGKFKIRFLICILVIFVLSLSAHAQQNAVGGSLVRKLSIQQLKQIIELEGWPLTSESESLLMSRINGSSVGIILTESGGTLLMASKKQDPSNSISAEAMNNFNSNQEGKAVMFKDESDKSVWMITRLDLEGGVSSEKLRFFLRNSKEIHASWRFSFS